MPPENKDIFVISNVGLNAELDKIDNDIKKTSFEDTLKLIGKSKSTCIRFTFKEFCNNHPKMFGDAKYSVYSFGIAFEPLLRVN